MSYSVDEQRKAIAWKEVTAALPIEAKRPARYINKDGVRRGHPVDYCRPAEYAAFNLLPEVRQLVLDLFAELKIPWHAGVDEGPSNHLLSSQVQCANALGQ